MTTIDYKQIIEVEKKQIEARRSVSKTSNRSSETVGLALSGGGIRAACFSLGIISALVERDVWKDVDYVSSVSGGGYTAAATLSAACESGTALNAIQIKKILDSVKKRSGFLDGPGLAMIGMVISGFFSTLIVLSSFFALLSLISVIATTYDNKPLKIFIPSCAVAAVVFWLFGFLKKHGTRKMPKADFQARAYFCAKIAAGLCALFSEVELFWWLSRHITALHTLLTVLGVTIAVTWWYLCQTPSKPQIRRAQRLYKVISLPLIFAFLAGCFVMVGDHLSNVALAFILVSYLAALALVLVAVCFNPNRLNFGFWFYRRSLQKTFAGESAHFALKDLAKHTDLAPISIFNCFAQFAKIYHPHGERLKARHGGVNFAVSPNFSGSQATRFFSSSEWNAATASNLWALVTLSGAALDAHPLRMSPLKSTLLRTTNAGLGRWVSNPGASLHRREGYPTFIDTIRSIFEMTSSEDRWLRLSDGGHFENLGLYELVARQCTHIVVVDAGFDPNFEYFDLGTATQRCYEDFGANIHLPVERGNALTKSEPYLRGKVVYKDGTEAKLLYIKLSAGQSHSLRLQLRGAYDVGFPHEPTTTQYVDDDFVQAYYDLGLESGLAAFPKHLPLIATF